MEEQAKVKSIGFKKKIIIVLIVLVVVFLVSFFGLNLMYYKTRGVENLSAQETVEKYFEYYNNGNLKGMDMLKADSFADNNVKWYNSYSVSYLTQSIKIEKISKAEVPHDFSKGDAYADYEVYAVNFTPPTDCNTDFWFIAVSKENEGESWKICDMFTGW